MCDKYKISERSNEKEILRKITDLMRCKACNASRVGFLWSALAASILSLSLVYSCRHIPREDAILPETSTPFYVGLSRTVSAKTTPIKVDDLNRRAYAPSERRKKPSNAVVDTVQRILVYVVSFWRKKLQWGMK